MAVYTEVSETQANDLMQALNLGQLTALRGIEGGIENTNYFATTDQGETLSGAAAFAAMWREIPPLRPLGLMAQNRVVLALLERTYTLFLKVRPLLQRLAR